ncbi:MAG: response regulator transcription factor [Terrabacter sp.]
MKIVIADDHRILLDALGAALTARGLEVVALASTTHDALEAVAEHDPDACLMDFSFPEGTCQQALRQMSNLHPRTSIVVLSGNVDAGVVGAALGAGAAGFVSKAGSIDEICQALDKAVLGGVAVDHRLLQQVLSPRTEPGALWGLRFLTRREWDVLKCITQGQTTKQIAATLQIRHATARTHVQRLLAKLGVHSRLEAAVLMAQHAHEYTWPDHVGR